MPPSLKCRESGFVQSIIVLLRSRPSDRTLSKNMSLHHQLTDLGMQPGHLGIAVLLALRNLIIEDLGKFIDRLPFLSGGHPRRMDFVRGR